MQIGILEPDGFSSHAVSGLNSLGPVHRYDGIGLEPFLLDKSVLFVRLAYKIDDDFLEKAPCLNWLCTPTTGLNHVDLEAAKKRSVNIVSLKGETEFLMKIRATPEHTLGLILSLIRKQGLAMQSVQKQEWLRDKFIGEELYDNTVGIIGLGRVGSCVAGYCKSLGAKVSFFDPEVKSPGVGLIKADTQEGLIKNNKIILLCASHKAKSKPILSREHIMLLENKFFINTSRGELIDEEALLEVVGDGLLSGVAIDVIGEELGSNNLDSWANLTKTHNVIVTPHISGATTNSMTKTELFIVQKLYKLLGKQY